MPRLFLLALSLSACAGCPPAPPAPLGMPDGGGDVFDRACANLARLGVPPGESPKCADGLRRSGPELGVDAHEQCLADAADKAAACGCMGGCP